MKERRENPVRFLWVFFNEMNITEYLGV